MTISVSGARLFIIKSEYKNKLFFQQKFGISETLANTISNRGYDQDTIPDFLSPKIKHLLPNPNLLLGMEGAIQRIISAIKNREKIVIYGDYDVDGATSSATLKNYFKKIRYDVDIYIPDRIIEGYGPNKDAFLKLKKAGYSVCITVDCGIVAHDQIKFAQDNELDVIIVDHHISSETLPEAVAIVNPNRLDQKLISGTENLAAVGVCFLLLIALNKRLKEMNFFAEIEEPNLLDFLDLVALGTVCDIVKLTQINRALVSTGLKVIQQRKNLGLTTLIDQLEIIGNITSYHLGYIIGPHINAGGRISKSSLGSELLSTNSEQRALEISQELMVLNSRRKEIEKIACNEALIQVNCVKKNFVMVQSPDWHPGIIGIVASRLKDHFYLPTIVISQSGLIGKASCRSISGTNLGAIVLEAKAADLIIEGGGHKMAAGFSVENDKIEKLELFLCEKFSDIDTERVIKIDDEINLQTITQLFCLELEKLSPFGMGNSEPKFLLKNIRIMSSKIIKEEHVSCIIQDTVTGKTMRGFAFKSSGNTLGKSLINSAVTKLVIKVKSGYWQGRLAPEIIIEDACL